MEVCMKIACRTSIMVAAIIGLVGASVATARERDERGRCTAVGGTVLTNLGVIDANTTLGTATGDLRGAVAAAILSIAPGIDGTTVFMVQHHWVTEPGDTIALSVAKATATMVAPGLFAIVSYPLKIVGGTGRFNGATGRLDSIGEVDLNAGRTVFRYTGKVCFAGGEEQ
jgi:hypothetical protein